MSIQLLRAYQLRRFYYEQYFDQTLFRFSTDSQIFPQRTKISPRPNVTSFSLSQTTSFPQRISIFVLSYAFNFTQIFSSFFKDSINTATGKTGTDFYIFPIRRQSREYFQPIFTGINQHLLYSCCKVQISINLKRRIFGPQIWSI